MSKAKTPSDFLADLHRKDKTVADWCREKGFSQQLCYRVLSGKTLGRWGEARRIVKAMGITPPPMLGQRTAKRAAA